MFVILSHLYLSTEFFDLFLGLWHANTSQLPFGPRILIMICQGQKQGANSFVMLIGYLDTSLLAGHGSLLM